MNEVFEGSYQAIIIDFGHMGKENRAPTQSCQQHKDKKWLPPSYLKGEEPAGRLVDVYSFGYLLYQIRKYAKVSGLDAAIKSAYNPRNNRPVLSVIIQYL